MTQWLMWQMGGLGPMSGQGGHFRFYAAEKIPYAIERYQNEVRLLYGVMDKRLADRACLAGEDSIADIARWPWVTLHERLEVWLDGFLNLKRWYEALRARPAVDKGYALRRELRTSPPADDEARKWLFGQKPQT